MNKNMYSVGVVIMAVKVILKASQGNSINEKEEVQSLILKAPKSWKALIRTFPLVRYIIFRNA